MFTELGVVGSSGSGSEGGASQEDRKNTKRLPMMNKSLFDKAIGVVL